MNFYSKLDAQGRVLFHCLVRPILAVMLISVLSVFFNEEEMGGKIGIIVIGLFLGIACGVGLYTEVRAQLRELNEQAGAKDVP